MPVYMFLMRSLPLSSCYPVQSCKFISNIISLVPYSMLPYNIFRSHDLTKMLYFMIPEECKPYDIWINFFGAIKICRRDM